MAVRVLIDRAARLVRSTFSDVVTLVDFLEGRLIVLKHPDWAPSFTHVLDLTAVTNLHVPQEALRQLASMRPIFEPAALQVVVVRPESPVLGFVRSYERFASGTGRTIRIVESPEEAELLVRSR